MHPVKRSLLVLAGTLALAAVVASCRTAGPDDPEFVGFAVIDAAGEICLQLRGVEPDGTVAESYRCYPPSDPDYARVRDRVGPIRVGERKVLTRPE